MAKGSQLSQLKSALSQAGITGQNASSGVKRKRGKSLSEAQDRDKKAAKLEAIKQRMNPFDVKVTKLKHDIGGRKTKGVTGKPAKSKQSGLAHRNKVLLQEYTDKDRAGGFIDRRFGENDPSMDPEEKMLERYTRERQRVSRSSAYNLEDDEDLTHYGQSLSKLDDFDTVGLGLDDEDDISGGLSHDVVKRTHFGGFDDDDDDEENEDNEMPARKKSKAEVMLEVMAKSKEHKMRRQMEKMQDDETRHQLDAEFASLRALLYAPDPSSSGSNSMPLGEKRRSVLAQEHEEDYDEYDRHVKELVFDRKAHPKDRAKTEEELAVIAKIALEKEERNRLRRMRGEENEIDIEDTKRNRKSQRKRQPDSDDLDDGLDLGEISILGEGLGEDDEALSKSSHGSVEDGAISEGSEEFLGDRDSEDNDDSESAEEEGDVSAEKLTMSNSAHTTLKPKSKFTELPFTFDCPLNHTEFLEIIDGIKADDVPTVVDRIRTLYHPSLGIDHHEKLQGLTISLIDHVLYIMSGSLATHGLLTALLPHVTTLCKAYPVQSAQHVLDKLALMHKNLKSGLSIGASNTSAKTWPGIPELTLFRLIGVLWPTSDMNHAVITPCRLLIGAYLGLSRIRNIGDLSCGLFLTTLFCQFEQLAKRLVPEVINFVVNAVLHLCPHTYHKPTVLPGLFPSPDFDVARMNLYRSTSLVPKPPNLVLVMSSDETSEQTKIDLLGLSLRLLAEFADLYKGLDSFIEIYEPIISVLSALRPKKVSKSIAVQVTALLDQLARLVKFSRQSRRPLTLQAHKPIPIPTFIPKFDTATSSYMRRQDPDHERNAASKMRYQYKQERKGAMRELRKDNKFLADVQQKQQQEKDRAYKDSMNKVFSSMQGERAEQKAMDREKVKEQRRAGMK